MLLYYVIKHTARKQDWQLEIICLVCFKLFKTEYYRHIDKVLQCRAACSKECFSILRKKYPTQGELERGKSISNAWKNITPEKREHFLQKCREHGVSQWENVSLEIRDEWLANREKGHQIFQSSMKNDIEFRAHHSQKSSEGTKLVWELDKENMIRKTVETKRQNGSYTGTSKQEERFYQKLVELFGENDVKRWVPIKKWVLDFYIKSIDTYIEFDGMYWHGLLYPLETLEEKAKTSKQIASILKRYHKDRDKDKWFTENNFKLIRITDTQFSSNAETCISKIIQ